MVKEIVSLGLRADRERGDPSLGMGLSLKDAKALRQAAARQVDLVSIPGVAAADASSPAKGNAANPDGEDVSADSQTDGAVIQKQNGEKKLSPAEALFARVQAEVVKGDEVGGRLDGDAVVCLLAAAATASVTRRGVNETVCVLGKWNTNDVTL